MLNGNRKIVLLSCLGLGLSKEFLQNKILKKSQQEIDDRRGNKFDNMFYLSRRSTDVL